MICRLALLAIGYFLITFFLSIRSFTLRIYSASQRDRSVHRLVANDTCVIARSHVKLRANSQHCWANPTMLGVVASVLAVLCKRMQKLPTMLGPAVHGGKDTTHKTLKTMCSARAWPTNVGKSWANGSNIVTHAHRRSRNVRIVGSCWLKSLTGFKLCITTPNNTQQHATGCANGRSSMDI